MIGTEITITAALAIKAGDLATRNPGAAITIRYDDERSEHVWEVLVSDGSEDGGASYLVDDETGQVITDATRAGRWQQLCAYYDVDLDDTGLNGVQYSAEIERYAAAAREYAGTSSEVTESGIATYPTEREALEALGSAFIDGWAPDAVYDLDTGERIDLHVASPVVTRSEDQGTMENPLQSEPKPPYPEPALEWNEDTAEEGYDCPRCDAWIPISSRWCPDCELDTQTLGGETAA